MYAATCTPAMCAKTTDSAFVHFALFLCNRPGVLGDASSFKTVYQKPIDKGSAADSTPEHQKCMKERMHALCEIIAPFVHRRDSSVLAKELQREPQVCAAVVLN
jgi:hypothetical protein